MPSSRRSLLLPRLLAFLFLIFLFLLVFVESPFDFLSFSLSSFSPSHSFPIHLVLSHSSSLADKLLPGSPLLSHHLQPIPCQINPCEQEETEKTGYFGGGFLLLVTRSISVSFFFFLSSGIQDPPFGLFPDPRVCYPCLLGLTACNISAGLPSPVGSSIFPFCSGPCCHLDRLLTL